MRLFNDQHGFYCGIDLHAKSMHTRIVDAAGNKRLHRNFVNAKPEAWLRAIAPFQEDLVVGCESTFNWYWLADLCQEHQLPFVLGHAFYNGASDVRRVRPVTPSGTGATRSASTAP